MKKDTNSLRNSGLSKVWGKIVRPFQRNRPISKANLEETSTLKPSQYFLAEDDADVDYVFDRLRAYCYERFLETREMGLGSYLPEAPNLFWESGKLDPGRSYFYLKKHNEIGWLFERSGYGWVISRCEKIVEQDLFMRREEAWDVVNLFKLDGPFEHYRVASEKTGGQLISFLLYRRIAFEEVVSVDLQDWLTI
ncbi:MAG: hypothetical protein HRU09_07400 [Oligoflexales bacterium]|nr:hypothetical protein [Oligoflexales bacterium]